MIGVSTQRLRGIAGIDSETFEEIKKSLIDCGAITDKEISKAREEREKTSKETTYNLLMQGYTYGEISAEIPYSDEKYIMRITQKLKKEGRITDAEIEKARFEKNERRKMEAVLEGLKKGFSYQEIAESNKSLELSEQQFATCKKKLLESGAITEKQMLTAREKRKTERSKEIKENYEAPNDNKILVLSKLGFNISQIAKILEVGESYVSVRRTALCKKHKISKKELEELIKNREKDAEKRRNKVYNIATLDKELDSKTIQDHIEYTKASMKLGTMERSDIKALVAVLPVYPEFITAGNINLIVTYLTREKSDGIAAKFIKECKIALGPKDERNNMLIEADRLIMEHIAKKRNYTVKPVGPGGDDEISH